MRVAPTGQILAWAYREHAMRGWQGVPAILAALLGLGCVTCTSPKSEASASTDNAARSDVPAAASDSAAGASNGSANAVSAGSGGKVEFYSNDFLSQLASVDKRSGNPTKTFGRHSAYWYVEAERVVTGSAEVHDEWIDATIIQAGKGELLIGGSVTGGHLEGRGEHRGGQIHGGVQRGVSAGDFIVIPAGVPHQYELGQGDSLRYLTVKIAR